MGLNCFPVLQCEETESEIEIAFFFPTGWYRLISVVICDVLWMLCCQIDGLKELVQLSGVQEGNILHHCTFQSGFIWKTLLQRNYLIDVTWQTV